MMYPLSISLPHGSFGKAKNSIWNPGHHTTHTHTYISRVSLNIEQPNKPVIAHTSLIHTQTDTQTWPSNTLASISLSISCSHFFSNFDAVTSIHVSPISCYKSTHCASRSVRVLYSTYGCMSVCHQCTLFSVPQAVQFGPNCTKKKATNNVKCKRQWQQQTRKRNALNVHSLYLWWLK